MYSYAHIQTSSAILVRNPSVWEKFIFADNFPEGLLSSPGLSKLRPAKPFHLTTKTFFCYEKSNTFMKYLLIW